MAPFRVFFLTQCYSALAAPGLSGSNMFIAYLYIYLFHHISLIITLLHEVNSSVACHWADFPDSKYYSKAN